MGKLTEIEINGKVFEIDGASAYEIACEKGFSGTVEEWLASLADGATKKAEEHAESANVAREDAENERKMAEHARDEAVGHTADNIGKWLDEHPEATTTVQDKSLTDAKFTDELKVKTIKDYVTPQMFGAKGDGVTDDTEAIKSMFATVCGMGKVYFPSGDYLVTKPITVDQVPDIEMDGTLQAKHDGVCLFLGSTDKTTLSKHIKVNIAKQVNGGTDSVGLVIGAFSRSTFDLSRVSRFETNVKLLSVGSGIFFNTFNLGDLTYAKYGLYLDGADGYVNDNLFVGGTIGKTEDGASVTIIHGSSNVFLKNGMEGAGTCANIISGARNTFLYSRCEKSTCALMLGEDAGARNTMLLNYEDGVEQNNSKHCTSGVINTGIKNGCRFVAVEYPHFDETKILHSGRYTYLDTCKFITSSGVVRVGLKDTQLSVENGGLVLPSTALYLEFDTTKNKRFEFPYASDLMFGVYTSDGKVSLTEENIFSYIKVEAVGTTGFNKIYTTYNGVAGFTKPLAVQVSEAVTRLEVMVNNQTLKGFGILTEHPCVPLQDDILTVDALPSDGYMGARVSYQNVLYTYNGTMWCKVE